MWPKMLFELLPHFTRLLPMADKYLSTRSASEKAQEAALASLAAEVRGELGKATEAQGGIARQLQEQTTQIGELALDVTRSRMAVEGLEIRLGSLEQTWAMMEKRSRTIVRLVGATVGLLGLVLGLLIVMVVLVLHGMR
jgi:tetrahydromethanopterin S-methyltransferase subunit G